MGELVLAEAQGQKYWYHGQSQVEFPVPSSLACEIDRLVYVGYTSIRNGIYFFNRMSHVLHFIGKNNSLVTIEKVRKQFPTGALLKHQTLVAGIIRRGSDLAIDLDAENELLSVNLSGGKGPVQPLVDAILIRLPNGKSTFYIF